MTRGTGEKEKNQCKMRTLFYLEESGGGRGRMEKVKGEEVK